MFNALLQIVCVCVTRDDVCTCVLGLLSHSRTNTRANAVETSKSFKLPAFSTWHQGGCRQILVGCCENAQMLTSSFPKAYSHFPRKQGSGVPVCHGLVELPTTLLRSWPAINGVCWFVDDNEETNVKRIRYLKKSCPLLRWKIDKPSYKVSGQTSFQRPVIVMWKIVCKVARKFDGNDHVNKN